MTRIKNDTWYIGGSIEGTNDTSYLIVTKQRLFVQNWAFITLEMYSLTDCSQFPTSPVYFTEIQLLENNKSITPIWSKCRGQNPSICNTSLIINSSNITINF